MLQQYITIKKKLATELVIKKSKFICSVERTESQEAASQFIADVKKTYAKATHNCFAYVIGMNNEIQRSSDNGEPSGTAGHPILEVLKKKDVRNTVAVVTRYFGGIKLGTGGLIRAYSQATSKSLSKEALVICQPQQIYKLEVAYSQLGTLQHYLKEKKISVINIQYLVNVTLNVSVKQKEAQYFEKRIIDLLNGTATIKKGMLDYIELPYKN
ncbi:YigZ family protein [Liquorilactobacillus oeni]|uniref:YigZ family protein n=1 Tax=Liquorilactobacillus oeni DSM 19972 TaxID=1423777 RepID=A0A0R1M9M9_9LACO|nr:YigZ family protein [Liquorilactobacillus oeni]KRL04847.1 hypothetical protein FD46_GL001985 [Liquorilactobacillus oeni DSM 19972]